MSKTLPPDHDARLDRARLALDGLSVGDALGQTCFEDGNYEALLDDPRATAKAPWPYTDDTAMALSIYEVLHDHGRIDQDSLAKRFGARWKAQPWRGYGAGAHQLLGQISVGLDWRAASQVLFGGGSFGNGSAMRIAPLAGYFAEDSYETVAEQAALSAAVTHAHPEGIAGGIAAAVAGAYAWKNRDRRTDDAVKRGLIETVFDRTPDGAVRKGIGKALTVPLTGMSDAAAKKLGNGGRISCQDTVPFCVWVAARHLEDYQTALVNTIMMCGDIDTNAAIVGGIVALATGAGGIPEDWLTDREELVI
ncbi:MAG TPA: ADP-ribosylglycohydrolase family protein [Gemmataceae bacterium]|nr:ADP-ribosylglycohydrolase family protein [Gemmataceae bacterium]